VKTFITNSVLISLSLSGCATHSEFNSTGAGVMAWKNDLSAALIVPGNNSNLPRACMQMALTMNDINSKTSANISDSLLKVFSTIPKDATPSELAKFSNELTKTAKALNISTERTTFLLVGSFYLCQYQANGMTEANVKEIADTLIKTAGSIGAEKNGQP
jgi:hypothetical protein